MATISQVKIGETTYDIKDNNALPLNGGTLSGNVEVTGNVVADGEVDATDINVIGDVSAGGNITATGNVVAGGEVTANGHTYYPEFFYTEAADANDIKTTGIYHFKASITNAPMTAWGTLIVDFGVGTPYQIYIPDNQPYAYKRNYSSGSDTWTAWTMMFNPQAIGALPLTGGTLSGPVNVEVSSGVPTYRAKRTDTGVQVGLEVGGGGTNHGIWSYSMNRWLIYGDGTNVVVNGLNFKDAATARSSIGAQPAGNYVTTTNAASIAADTYASSERLWRINGTVNNSSASLNGHSVSLYVYTNGLSCYDHTDSSKSPWSMGTLSTSAPGAVNVANSTWTQLGTITLDKGTWVISVTTTFASNASGRRATYFGTSSTGSTISVADVASSTHAPANGGMSKYSSSTILRVTESTTLYCRAWQNSGATLSCQCKIVAYKVL